MTTSFTYKETPYDPKKSFIDILNAEGRDGWRFHSMAQRMSGSTDFKTGQPKVELVMIFERQRLAIEKPS